MPNLIVYLIVIATLFMSHKFVRGNWNLARQSRVSAHIH